MIILFMSMPSCRVLQMSQILRKTSVKTSQAVRRLWPPAYWEGEVGGPVCSPSLLLGVSADEERTPESQDDGAEGKLGSNNCPVLMVEAKMWTRFPESVFL